MQKQNYSIMSGEEKCNYFVNFIYSFLINSLNATTYSFNKIRFER